MALSDDNLGYLVSYDIFMFISFIGSVLSFVQSFNLKSGRTTHLILFGLLIVDTLFFFLAYVMLTFDQPLVSQLASPAVLELYEQYFCSYIYLLNIGFSFMNAVIVYLLFMWIELFMTAQYGNVLEQAKVAKRLMIARLIVCVIVILVTLISLVIAVKVDVSSESSLTLAFSFIAIFIAPVIIMAVIRWRSLFELMRENVTASSRNGSRFFDLTMASLLAILVFLLDNVFIGLYNAHNGSGELISNIFTSFIPVVILPYGVWFYFSPMRKHIYEERRLDSTTNTPSSLKSSETGSKNTDSKDTDGSLRSVNVEVSHSSDVTNSGFDTDHETYSKTQDGVV